MLEIHSTAEFRWLSQEPNRFLRPPHSGQGVCVSGCECEGKEWGVPVIHSACSELFKSKCCHGNSHGCHLLV